jgi:ubiquinone/menaquinone biosynthesis C-methylase UbiE
MQRVRTPELMDDPGIGRGELAGSLGYIRWVNRRLGGTAALLGHLRRWSRDWPRDRAVTLLDVGTGSADLPVAAVSWARGAGFDLRVTGVDKHPVTVELAREYVEGVGVAGKEEGEGPPAGEAGGLETRPTGEVGRLKTGPTGGVVEVVEADALRLVDLYGAGSFDYVHAGLFLHHLAEIEVLTVLRVMDRIARRGIVWNDLVRTRAGAVAVDVLTIGKPHIARHDARVSIRAGFTRPEVLDYARRVGLDYCSYRWSVWTHRFTLAGQKPGAWG